MRMLYWPFLLTATAFMVWTDTHTDEAPVILGILLILSLALGALFPGKALVTALLLGAAVPVAEILVHFGILRATWAASTGWPWPAFVAYVPALFGTGIGYLVGRSSSV